MGRSPRRSPDGIRPIIGYRYWTYRLGHGRAELHSLSYIEGLPGFGVDWGGAGSRWAVASCQWHDDDPGHIVPDEYHGCGLYAFKSLPQVCGDSFLDESMPAGEPDTDEVGNLVAGRVQLAGKIIEHEYGYRAERARIAGLIPERGTERRVILLAARLGLPLYPPPRRARRSVSWVPTRPRSSRLVRAVRRLVHAG